MSFQRSEFCVVNRFFFVCLSVTQYLHAEIEKKIQDLIWLPKNLMNLSFFTKIFDRSVQLAQVLVKRSPTLEALVGTKSKCIKLIFIGKITLVPVAF